MTRATKFKSVAAREVVTQNLTVSTISTAGVVAYTAAQVRGGLILRDPNGAGRADTLPTAADLYVGFGSPEAGQSFRFTIRNTADAAETITVSTATGLTLSGTMTIAQNNSKDFILRFDSPTAVTVYSLGTVVF